MSKSILSPVALEAVRILDLSFSVDPNGPKGEVRYDIKIDHKFTMEPTESDPARCRAVVTLSVTASLLDSDEQETARMNASIIAFGMLSMPRDIDEEIAIKTLRLNGISMLYAHARTVLAAVAAGSPMEHFLLPPIDVKEYLNGLANREE